MKMDEKEEIKNKVGVSFKRIPFETEIDLYPKMNPLVDSKSEKSDDAGDMTLLTSVQTEERLRDAMQHRAREGEEEFHLPVPLKRIDSDLHQYHTQATGSTARTRVEQTENDNVIHRALIDEIDQSAAPKAEAKGKTGKKENTLTRMFKGIRVDKSKQDESDDKVGAHVSISKIFQRINPVGKASRENFSKVFHRIGDALQKKNEGEDSSVSKGRSHDSRRWESQPDTTKLGHGEQRCPMIGEKMFRCRPSNTDNRKTTG